MNHQVAANKGNPTVSRHVACRAECFKQPCQLSCTPAERRGAPWALLSRICGCFRVRTVSFSHVLWFPFLPDLVALHTSLHSRTWCSMHDVSCELSHDVVAVVTSKLLRY